MRYLVCGGRDFNDKTLFQKTMQELARVVGEPDIIIHGCANGADSLASRWAEYHRIPELRCPADWKKWGKAAGSIRNKIMLDVGWPDVVVAFPGGRGTADMVAQARRAQTRFETDVRVIEVQGRYP